MLKSVLVIKANTYALNAISVIMNKLNVLLKVRESYEYKRF